MEGVDVIYWISLDSAVKRQAHMKSMLKDDAFKKIKTTKIRAIPFKYADIDKWFVRPVENKLRNNSIRLHEYGCLLSHLNTIRTFSNSSHETALIFEDDISLDLKQYWTKTVQDVIDGAPKDWEIIRLFDTGVVEQTNSYKALTFPCFDKGFNTAPACSWSMSSYIINKTAAKKIMRLLWKNRKYHLPRNSYFVADYLLNDLLKSYAYKYPMFMPKNNNDSQIHIHSDAHHCSLGEGRRNNINRTRIVKMYKNKTRRRR